MLMDGLKVLLLGMGTVTVFLLLLLALILLLGFVCRRFTNKEFTASQPAASSKPASSVSNSDAVVAVISAAVRQFRLDREQPGDLVYEENPVS